MMKTALLRRVEPDDVVERRENRIDDDTVRAAAKIVEDIRLRGGAALAEHSERLGDIDPGGRLVRGEDDLADALRSLPGRERAILERTASNIRRFAEAQRASLKEMTIDVPGGKAGHKIVPVERAGCYAPGGRFPLPSSVLMTAVTAAAAGVEEIWVSSPRPAPATLAAAALAGAKALVAAGGAQAVAAMAFGAGEIPACDVVVGPGNKWVTAAKRIVSSHVKIDMLAGPSELVVVADASADPGVIAADLLAQAEHDVDAWPILVSLARELIDRVNEELDIQVRTLPTAEIAHAGLANGFAVFAHGLEEAVTLCDRLAPEHLELMIEDAEGQFERFSHYGAIFLGGHSAEVFGDYGAGPNHVLPTGGTARYTGGLSVFDFLRLRTWLKVDEGRPASDMAGDAAELARMEGLEGHARAAEKRSGRK